MESIQTTEALVAHFTQKLSTLKHAVVLGSAVKDDEILTLADDLDTGLDSLMVDLKALRRHVQHQKTQLSQVENVKKDVTCFAERLQFAANNVPIKLSRRAISKKIETPDAVVAPQTSNSAIEVQQTVAHRCTYLDFITVDEFNAVPKYMKGRMSYDKINTVIEKLDHVYVEKYKILRQKKSKLNDINRKRYEVYKLQESKDTTGVEFIVERDITDFSSLKMDSSMRSIMTILRHVNLIYEIRGEGHVRFAIGRACY